MKLPFIMAAAAGIAVCSCTTDTTQYNGYLLNSTGDSIYVSISGGDKLLRNEVGIPNNGKVKVFFDNSNGDTELFDCSAIIDSLTYEREQSTITVISGESVITHNSVLSDDGTRVHDCVLEIR